MRISSLQESRPCGLIAFSTVLVFYIFGYMEIKEGGLVIIKGDNIENGGIKIVRGYEPSEGLAHKEKTLTEDELMKRIEKVRTHIGNTNRLWFPVCKYMMWRKMVPEGDFNSAVNILKKLYPDVKLNPDDLSSLNVLSFKKSLDEWDPTNAPVKGTTFNKYYTIAELISL